MPGALRIGHSLVGHRLLRVVGRGANSTVYLVEHEATRQLLAMKLVTLPAGPGLAAAGAQFLAAAQTACRLRHPGIVLSHASGVEGQVAWLTMEPVPGCDLVRYTRLPRLLPEALVLALTSRLAAALGFAHRQGVVHRDLKPANVLVDWASDRVKLADFGLARVSGAASTGTGVVLGTPAYMAPEQLAGALPSAATDLYALGAMLFELLCGRLPHEGASMGELLRQVAQEPAPGLLTLRPQLPPMLAALVASLLTKDPAARPADAAAVAAELLRCSQALPDGGAKSR